MWRKIAWKCRQVLYTLNLLQRCCYCIYSMDILLFSTFIVREILASIKSLSILWIICLFCSNPSIMTNKPWWRWKKKLLKPWKRHRVCWKQIFFYAFVYWILCQHPLHTYKYHFIWNACANVKQFHSNRRRTYKYRCGIVFYMTKYWWFLESCIKNLIKLFRILLKADESKHHHELCVSGCLYQVFNNNLEHATFEWFEIDRSNYAFSVFSLSMMIKQR